MTKSACGNVGGNKKGSGVPRTLVVLSSIFIFLSTFTIAGEQVALGLLFIFWVFYLVFKRFALPIRTALDPAVIIFILAGLLSALFSEDRLGSLINMRNLLLLSAVYLLAYIFSRGMPISKLVAILLFGSLGTSIYGIVMYFSRDVEWVLWRTPGPFSNAMTYGGVLMILCSVALSVVVTAGMSLRLRVLGLVAMVFTALALFFTFTRSSWLGMIASALVILYSSRRKLVVPFMAVLVVFIVVLPQPYSSRFYTMFDPDFRTNSIRLQLFKGGLAIFKEHPIIGVGARDLTPLYIKHKPPDATYVSGHLHNDFLQIAVSMGILGLASFVYLLFSFFKIALRNLNKSPPLRNTIALAAVGALTGFMVNGLFEWNFGDAEVVTLLYILVGLNLALSRAEEGGNYLIV